MEMMYLFHNWCPNCQKKEEEDSKRHKARLLDHKVNKKIRDTLETFKSNKTTC